MKTKCVIRITSSDIQKDDTKDDGTVVGIESTYAESYEGGYGENIPELPMEGIAVDDVSEGEDEEEEVNIQLDESSLDPAYSLKDGGENFEGYSECHSGISMDAKCVGLYEVPESLADDSGKGNICESDNYCDIDGEEFPEINKCGIHRTKKNNTNFLNDKNKA